MTPRPRQLRYRPDPDCVVDLFPATGTPRGITVGLVHGGFWRAEYDRAHLVPLATGLAAAGFDVGLVEYRRVGQPGGGFPGTATDVVAALIALAELPAAALQRAERTQPAGLVAVGHSAGGHLVAWAASRSPEGTPHCDRLTGAVAVAGVLDLAAGDRDRVGSGAIRAFLGSAPDTGPALDLDTGPGQVWRRADPARLRNAAPLTVISGAADVDVPPELAVSYQQSRTSEDAPVRLVQIPGAGHFDLIDPWHPGFAILVAAIADLAAPAPPG